MTLEQAIASAGMTPPAHLAPGRWMRFPGAGKGKSNRAGWCRIISPTLALYGDWSTGLSETWTDSAHRDDEATARLLAEARVRERAFASEQIARQKAAASKAEQLIREASTRPHLYLKNKGFPERAGLVHEDKLLVPVRDAADYARVISIQQIAMDGEKRFLPGSRTRGGIHRIGATLRAKRLVLCEGYATGLSLDAALQRLPGDHAVVVCFSARNLEIVAESFPTACVCADNDESKTGETSAQRTGRKWVMPPSVGSDFNDMHLSHGIHAVTDVLRSLTQ